LDAIWNVRVVTDNARRCNGVFPVSPRGGMEHREVSRSSRVHRAMRRILTFGLSLLVAPVAARAQVVEYYPVDAIGSVRAVTDPGGAVIERHDYLPFGEECTAGPCALNPGVGAGQPKRFTGKERDTETGFDYFGARYYGSKIGRLTTADPGTNIRESLVNPQRWNRYAYSLNNPLRYVGTQTGVRR